MSVLDEASLDAFRAAVWALTGLIRVRLRKDGAIDPDPLALDPGAPSRTSPTGSITTSGRPSAARGCGARPHGSMASGSAAIMRSATVTRSRSCPDERRGTTHRRTGRWVAARGRLTGTVVGHGPKVLPEPSRTDPSGPVPFGPKG